MMAKNEPKRCTMASKHVGAPIQHNLNIKMYSYPELLALFQLESVPRLTADHMKHAKQVVLRMHPDKSRLPSQYFLFYKKALDIIVEFYERDQKTSRPVPTAPVEYTPVRPGTLNRASTQSVQERIQDMDRDDFQTTFNRLYEENMVNREQQKQREDRHEWFRREDTTADWDHLGQRGGSIHDKFEQIKQTHASQQLATYRGVQSLHTTSGIGAGNMYEDDEVAGDAAAGVYVTADPFAKLKYDDLRKVHKDQTVLSVSERDLQKVTQYGSVDQLRAARERAPEPLDEQRARDMLEAQEHEQRQVFEMRAYEAKLRAMHYEKKNQQVMSHFLRLT